MLGFENNAMSPFSYATLYLILLHSLPINYINHHFNLLLIALKPKYDTMFMATCINKAYRPNAHLLYIVMHYNGNII